jgi:hypothetical protein
MQQTFVRNVGVIIKGNSVEGTDLGLFKSYSGIFLEWTGPIERLKCLKKALAGSPGVFT